MRGGRLPAAVSGTMLATLLTVALPTPAGAEEPLDLPGELTQLSVLIPDPTTLEAQQREWAERTGLQVFVVVVDNYGGDTAQEWLEETAELSGLGDQDLALVVATNEPTAALRAPSGTRLPEADLQRITTSLETHTDAGEPRIAIEEAVAALTNLDPVAPGAAARRTAGWGVAAAVVLAASIALVLWWRSRRNTAQRLAQAQVRAEELSTELGAGVVALDQELAEARLAVDLADAEVERATTVDVRAQLDTAEREALEVHRRRSDLTLGPADDLTWRLDAPAAVTELEGIHALVTAARQRLQGATEELRQLLS